MRGRKVRITCKRCGAAIIVDGTSLGAAASGGADQPPPAANPAAAESGDAPVAAAAPPAAVAAAPPAPDAPQPAPVAPAVTSAEAAMPAADPAKAVGAASGTPNVEADASTKTSPAVKVALKPLGGAKAFGGAAKPLASIGKSPAGVDTKAAAFPKTAGASKGLSLAKGGATAGSTATASSIATAPSTATAATGAATQAARAAAVPRAAAAVRALAPSALPDRTWTVAVTDDDHREMTLAQITDAYAAQTIDAETFVWRDGMQDWLMPFEIAEIATALRARRLSPRTSAGPETATAGPLLGEEPAGAWREPARWDRAEPPADEPNFDDVTVAMEAPKAKALLEAVQEGENAAAKKDDSPNKPVAPATDAAKHDEPTAVAPPFAVTKELLGFGFDEDDKASSPRADTVEDAIARLGEGLDDADRLPERLPFELAPSAMPARAAMKSTADGVAKPKDLFARKPEGDDVSFDGPPEPKEPESPAALTGARNESSVLFSLDQLAKPAAKSPAATRSAKRDEAALLLGSSGPSSDGAKVANMGGGGLFAQTNMAAPDFTAAAPPSVPPAAQRRSSGAPAAPTSKSGAGIWVGLGLLLAVAGTGFYLSRGQTPAPAPSATLAAAPPPPAPAEPAATAATAEPAATATGSAAAEAPPASASGASAAGSAAPASSGSATAAPGAASAAPATPTAARPSNTPATPKATAAAAEPAAAEGPEFDKDAASAALATAAANAEGQCGTEEGTHGAGKVQVTFANSGRATNALVSGDFAGSALGGCVARIFRAIHVPAFGGDSVRVSRTVRIP